MTKTLKHKPGLIGYIRTDLQSADFESQLKAITSYCDLNGLKLQKVFSDRGLPGAGLQEALIAVAQAHGIVAVDLNKFVQHHDDRLRDLRPLVHHFLCHKGKHLVTITEGIDTGSLSGQRLAVDLINQVKEA